MKRLCTREAVTLLSAMAAGIFVLGTAACTELGGETSRAETDGSRPGEAEDRGDGLHHLYVSAVSFPETYDWKRDTLFGMATAEILLFRDGEQILTIPAGSSREAGTEADRHHIAGGHLYTEKCMEGQTVILRDGLPFCRYTPEEQIRGIVADGRYVHTLGQNLRGQGFTLRRNGKTVQSWPEGTVVGSFSDLTYAETGALYVDRGRLCFSYHTDRDGRRRWFHVADDRESEVPGTEGLTNIFDVRLASGRSYAVGAAGLWNAPILLVDGVRHDLSHTLYSVPANDYRICSQDGRTFLTGSFNWPGDSHPSTAFWDENGMLARFGGSLRAFRFDGDKTDRVTYYDGRLFSVDYGEDRTRWSEPLVLMTPQCTCLTDEGWVLGLSARDGSSMPVLWTQGRSEPLDINGYITGVRWE